MDDAFITLHFGFRFIFLLFSLWCTGREGIALF
jgi:hypothetical protein